jgi:hypothetical protein
MEQRPLPASSELPPWFYMTRQTSGQGQKKRIAPGLIRIRTSNTNERTNEHPLAEKYAVVHLATADE